MFKNGLFKRLFNYSNSRRMVSNEIKPFINEKGEKNLYQCQIPVKISNNEKANLNIVYQVYILFFKLLSNKLL